MLSNSKLTTLDHSQLLVRYPRLEVCADSILKAINLIIESYGNKGKVITFGNGGSSADAEHFCGELVKNFILPRRLTKDQVTLLDKVDPELSKHLHQSLPAISLGVAHSTISAYSNDAHPEFAFAQMIWGLAQNHDVAFGISTSGHSKNVVNALKVAVARNIKSVALTGEKSSPCEELATVTIKVPESVTHKAQELHLPVYHAICIELECYFFSEFI